MDVDRGFSLKERMEKLLREIKKKDTVYLEGYCDGVCDMFNEALKGDKDD
jgi:hypothetical protein